MALLLTIKTYIMTAEEIKNLIDQKIAGQGSMVDVGGALPTILKEIVDIAGQGGGGEQADLFVTDTESPSYVKGIATIEASSEPHTVSEDFLDDIMTNDIFIRAIVNDRVALLAKVPLTNAIRTALNEYLGDIDEKAYVKRFWGVVEYGENDSIDLYGGVALFNYDKPIVGADSVIFIDNL